METFTFAVGDFDDDGKLDFVTRSSTVEAMALYHGNGDGTFTEHTIPGWDHTALIAGIDANGDGKADVVLEDASGVQVFLNAGGGKFTPSTAVTGAGGQIVVSGDLDGDGLADLVFTNTPGLNVYLNSGGTGFGTVKQVAVTNTVSGVAIGDVNGDGANDFVVTDGNDLTVILHR